ncbi:hypothetical protein CERZMDRAFT_96133 [Cercospora zeae-maydis SCOH1-5]|uniref:Uncharacterized protein n=1 Tax=Cercospora zeae-maydis SCOH1-5 TaxID=717836 RepID=A0A6A6FKY5_9PEZI|nr:hypothetical protein CERZMDRAFT_96133 [Cercospora zeae-maydis SCOH1-5]
MLLENVSALVALLASGVLAKDRTECYAAMTTKNAPRYLQTKYSTTVTDGKKGTSTSIIYTEITTTSNSVSTSTSTSTSVVQVLKETVAPAPAGFIPVRSSLPDSTFTNNTRRRRSPDTLRKRNSRTQKQYPKGVQCNVYTRSKHCVIKHRTVTKTKQASYPQTIPVKMTKIVTKTVYPEAKVTVTSTKTRASTAMRNSQCTLIYNIITTTATTTSTSTNVAGPTTIFGVCLSTANYANLATGRPIAAVDEFPEGRVFLKAITVKENAYQCCNAAMLARGNVGDLVRSPQVFLFRPPQADDGEGEDAP